MAGENVDLQNMGVSHAIGLRKLSTTTVNSIKKLLTAAEADVVVQIQKLDPASVATRYTRARLERLLKELKALNKDVYKAVAAKLKTDLSNIGSYETTFQAKAIAPVAKVKVGDFVLPSRQRLVAAVTAEPLQGRLLGEWVDGLEAGTYNRVRDAVRLSVVEGEGVADTVKRIRGTAALGFKDGMYAISKRSAEALVRTAVNHVSTTARQMTFEENEDILDGWRYVATLEPTTCPVCAALDGQVFDLGEGPLPPRHINCRCTTVPVLKDGGDTKPQTYAKWLKDQDEETQDEALGPTRGELYRQGKLPITKFADDNRAYTIEELSKKEPKAFKRAGIEEK